MSRKSLIASLASKETSAALTRAATAADLTVLLLQAKVSRAELADRLGWTRARVSQVLQGKANLTLDTVSAVSGALDHSFDIVFRPSNSARHVQTWERCARPKVVQMVRYAQKGAAALPEKRHSRFEMPTSSLTTLRQEVLEKGELEWSDAA